MNKKPGKHRRGNRKNIDNLSAGYYEIWGSDLILSMSQVEFEVITAYDFDEWDFEVGFDKEI